MPTQYPFDRQAEVQEPSSAQSAQEERLISRAEAARYLGVPASTIYHWARTGRLRCVVTLGGHMRFSRADLDGIKPRRARGSGWSPPRRVPDPAQGHAPDPPGRGNESLP